MIALVEGEVGGLGDSHVVVMVGGIGLQVFVPAVTRTKLRVGDSILLYTHLIVREDLLALYGFENDAERQLFILLLGVDGVGPKVALSVLSTLSVDAVRRAVAAEQAEMFSRVPGVGKRTAQKIFLHLQDRLKFEPGAFEAAAGFTQVDESVLEALTTLGYSVVEAQTALQSIPARCAR